MKYNDYLPIYVQISHKIITNISKEKIKKLEMLPPIRKMASEYNVTTKTIQKVFEYLENKGVIFRKQSVGAFINVEQKDTKILLIHLINDYKKEYFEKARLLNFTKEDALEIILKEDSR